MGGENMLWNLSFDIMFLEADSCPRARLLENADSLLGTDDVRGKIS